MDPIGVGLGLGGRRARLGVADPMRLLADAVLFLGLGLAIVGVSPFAGDGGGDQSGGDAIGRLFPITLFLATLPLIIARWALVRTLLTRNWMLVVTLGWLVLSIVWSDFPGLSLRRTGFLLISYLTALGIAAWADDIERATRVMAVLLVLVVFVDLVSIPLVPHLAVTDEGARGMHMQKNQAGGVCLFAFIVLSMMVPSMTRLKGLLFVLGCLAMTVILLVLTKSKTSMALVGLYLTFCLPLGAGLAWERGRGIVLLLVAGLAVSLFILAVGINGWTLPDVLEVVFGDPTFTGRTGIWDFASDQIAKRPLLGTGYGAFWDVGAENDPLRHATNWLRDVGLGVINQTHNGYIDLWVQAGLPAMIGGILVMVRPLILAGRHLARDSWSRAHWTGYAQIFCLMLLFLIYNLMESAILSRVHFFSFIIFLYILFAERWSMPDIALSRRSSSQAWGAPRA